MADIRVASRYVKSLLALAVEQGALEEVHRDMQLFSLVCRENRNFVSLLRSPVIRHENKRAILKKLFSGKISPLSLAIINMVTHKNREAILPEIAAEFHNAYNRSKGIGKAYLTTAVPASKELLDTMQGISKKLTNLQTIELQTNVDSDLIGGFVLNVGDQQIDASVRSKLRTLSLKFEENYFVKKD